MLLKGLDHITINVTDLAKSFEFYENVLELEKIGTVDLGDHTLHYMGLPGGSRLELIEYHFDNLLIKAKNTDIGIFRHVAFVVDSLDEIKKRCDKYNVKINLQPIFVEKLNCKVLLIEDPNGVELELVEKV